MSRQFEWTELDEAASKEGRAILKSFKSRRPRRPRGVNKKDIQRHTEDIFEKLRNVIELEKVCL